MQLLVIQFTIKMLHMRFKQVSTIVVEISLFKSSNIKIAPFTIKWAKIVFFCYNSHEVRLFVAVCTVCMLMLPSC